MQVWVGRGRFGRQFNPNRRLGLLGRSCWLRGDRAAGGRRNDKPGLARWTTDSQAHPRCCHQNVLTTFRAIELELGFRWQGFRFHPDRLRRIAGQQPLAHSRRETERNTYLANGVGRGVRRLFPHACEPRRILSPGGFRAQTTCCALLPEGDWHPKMCAQLSGIGLGKVACQRGGNLRAPRRSQLIQRPAQNRSAGG
jgi:hypothetical protein